MRQLVILVHGMRVDRTRELEAEQALERAGLLVTITRYDHVSALALLAGRFFAALQRVAINRIARQLQASILTAKADQVSVIAHGFGTHAISQILSEHPEVRLHRVIFYGATIFGQPSFAQITDRFSPPLVNEIGTGDFVSTLLQGSAGRHGSSGSHGFVDPAVVNRWHQGLSHRDLLRKDFVSRYWVPFLAWGQVISPPQSAQEAGELLTSGAASSVPSATQFFGRTALALTAVGAFAVGALIDRIAQIGPHDALLYFVAAFFGAIVGAVELVSRYRDMPSIVFRTFEGMSYLLMNSVVAIFAFWLLQQWAPRYNFPFGSSDIERLVVACLGSSIFLRSVLIKVRIDDNEIPIGPAIILHILLAASDRAYDRSMASVHAESVSAIMRDVTFDRARHALPYHCFALAQTVTADQRKEIQSRIEDLEHAELSDHMKANLLGLLLINVVGEAVLSMAVGNLGAQIRSSAIAAREVSEAVHALDQRVESLLAQPTLVRYDGILRISVYQGDTPFFFRASVLTVEKGKEAVLSLRFLPTQTGEPAASRVAAENSAGSPGPAIEPANLEGNAIPVRELEAQVSIAKGKIQSLITFDIEIDTDGVAFLRESASCSFDVVEPSPEMAFPFVAANNGDYEVFVEVSQLNRLIQVVPIVIRVAAPTPPTDIVRDA